MFTVDETTLTQDQYNAMLLASSDPDAHAFWRVIAHQYNLEFGFLGSVAGVTGVNTVTGWDAEQVGDYLFYVNSTEKKVRRYQLSTNTIADVTPASLAETDYKLSSDGNRLFLWGKGSSYLRRYSDDFGASWTSWATGPSSADYTHIAPVRQNAHAIYQDATKKVSNLRFVDWPIASSSTVTNSNIWWPYEVFAFDAVNVTGSVEYGQDIAQFYYPLPGPDWTEGAGTVEADFGTPRTIKRVRLKPHNAILPYSTPNTFYVEYWNGSTWVDTGIAPLTAIQFPNVPANNVDVTSLVPTTISASKWRVRWTGSGPYSFDISHTTFTTGIIEFYEQIGTPITDILVMQTEVPGAISAQYDSTAESKEEYWLRSGGLVSIVYKDNTWQPHHEVDVVDHLTSYNKREGVMLSKINNFVYLTSWGTNGTSTFYDSGLRLYRTKNGEFWSMGELQYVPGLTSNAKLFQYGDYVYLMDSHMTLWTGYSTLYTEYSALATQMELTDNIQTYQLEREQMAQATMTFKNDTFIDTNIDFFNRRVLLEHYAGYLLPGDSEPTYIKIATTEVDSLDKDEQTKGFVYRLTSRDQLSWMTDFYKSEDAQYRQGQFVGADNYSNNDNANYGGLSSSVILAGEWKASSGKLSINTVQDAFVVSSMKTDLQNGVVQVRIETNGFTVSPTKLCGVSFRVVNKNNLFYVVRDTNAGNVKLYRRVNNSDTLLATFTSNIPSGAHTEEDMRVEFYYGTVNVYLKHITSNAWGLCGTHTLDYSGSTLASGDLYKVKENKSQVGYVGLYAKVLSGTSTIYFKNFTVSTYHLPQTVQDAFSWYAAKGDIHDLKTQTPLISSADVQELGAYGPNISKFNDPTNNLSVVPTTTDPVWSWDGTRLIADFDNAREITKLHVLLSVYHGSTHYQPPSPNFVIALDYWNGSAWVDSGMTPINIYVGSGTTLWGSYEDTQLITSGVSSDKWALRATSGQNLGNLLNRTFLRVAAVIDLHESIPVNTKKLLFRNGLYEWHKEAHDETLAIYHYPAGSNVVDYYEFAFNGSGNLVITKGEGFSSSTVYTGGFVYANPSKLHVAVWETQLGNSAEPWWRIFTFWNNGVVADVYTENVAEPMGIPLYATPPENASVVDLGDFVEWLTLDPNETPMSALSRTTEGRYMKFFMRGNGQLRAWNPRETTADFTFDDDETLQVSTSDDKREVHSHVRQLGAYAWADFVRPDLFPKYGHKYIEINNPYLMTEAECRYQAELSIKRMEEQAEKRTFDTRFTPFTEPEDHVIVGSGDWIIEAISLDFRYGQIAQRIALRRYVFAS